LAKKARKKEVVAIVKLQAPGGQATPAPPVGPALGQHGVNIGQFVQQFNAATGSLNGMPVTVVIEIYKDKSFSFKVKSPPAAVLLKDAAKIAKGSGVPNREKVATVTRAQVRSIAERKMPDLNAYDLDAGEKIIAGTARSMGIDIVD
jgi:large subunit ribosomal protein L11